MRAGGADAWAVRGRCAALHGMRCVGGASAMRCAARDAMRFRVGGL